VLLRGQPLYVERKAYSEVIERVADMTKKIKLGRAWPPTRRWVRW
jgi:hypothetical protein